LVLSISLEDIEEHIPLTTLTRSTLRKLILFFLSLTFWQNSHRRRLKTTVFIYQSKIQKSFIDFQE
jgi:hypothetical protein